MIYYKANNRKSDVMKDLLRLINFCLYVMQDIGLDIERKLGIGNKDFLRKT